LEVEDVAMQPERTALLTAARNLAPVLEHRAGEGDPAATLPRDLVEELRTSGLFRMFLPRALGGFEADPVTFAQVIETLAHADGSAAWNTMVGNSTAFFAWLDPTTAYELVGRGPDFISAAMFGPHGAAVPVDDGNFAVSGRWPFTSGAPHADWFQLGVIVMDEHGTPLFSDDGRPDWRFAFLRAEEVIIDQTWNAAGLRATGSHDVVAEAAVIATDRLAAPLFDPPHHDGPLWRIPFFALVGIQMAGVPLGAGRRALDEFRTLAIEKQRLPGTTLAADTHVQVQLAKAEAGLRAARALVYETIGDIWTSACAGDEITLNQRADLLLAVQHAMAVALEAADTAFTLAGASVVPAHAPLHRCFHDLRAAAQHIYFAADSWARCSRVRFAIDQPTFMM
jgi:indole-3-acetate monooxygenase